MNEYLFAKIVILKGTMYMDCHKTFTKFGIFTHKTINIHPQKS